MPAVALLPARHFNEIAASPPDIEALRAQYDEISAALEDAGDHESAMAVFHRWDALRRRFSTWASLTELHFQQDTSNETYRAENERLNDLRPKIESLDVAIKKKYLASPVRETLEGELGTYLFARWELDVTAFDPVIEPNAVREAQISDKYVELLASAHFEYNGEHLNLSTISKFRENADRSLREGAVRTAWAFFAQHAGELDHLYGDLVAVRTEMARQLDYPTFTELGYRRMMRTDYGPAEVARYREEIVREIVPLAGRIVERQARDLGIERVMFWDESVYDANGAPRPPEPHDRFMQAARSAFTNIAPEIGSFASMMMDGDLLDLKSRKAKAGGGFCTSFPTYGLPYIFANFNGTTGDVNVLLHEMGHAFQGFSSRGMDVSEYLWPTYEACEVHSMSMEFLGAPQMEQFFGENAARYRDQHLRSSIMFLPYGAAVDHFQHFVYDNPDASPQDRKAFWKQLEATYLPWRRYGGIEHLENGGAWQLQRHIYQMPFYYIDYTLALCCALQFWVRSLDDYEGALADYIALCKRGGAQPFQALVKGAGLRSPFEPGALHAVAQRAAQVLGT